jgi:repressor of nif and glnA expression
MGGLITLFPSGEKVGEMMVPAGYVGVGTVCSITLNGVLLGQKIPMSSRFGGLLEIQDSKPTRFVAIINYDGTSLDPLEIFIKSGMTDYLGATGDGNGLIGAGFREIPAQTRERVMEIAEKLEKIGLGGFLTIGMPNGNVSEIPVSEGNVGAIVIGGLNPIAILEEAGFEVHSRALSGIVPYHLLFSYNELEERASELVNR